MRRRQIVAAAVAATCLAVPTGVAAHELDHPVPNTFSQPTPVSTTNFNAGGPGAKWEPMAFLPTGNAHSDLDFFTQKGETFASVGVLTVASGNGGGQTIAQLTDKGEPTRTPRIVGSQPSASCLSLNDSVTGLQHDVEATPKGNTIQNTNIPGMQRSDAQLLLDASDAPGRCHDNGNSGIGSPQGGIEIIDITDVRNPVEIGLTSHAGQSHTVNVDPRRPHIAYSITSDNVGTERRTPDAPLTRRNDRPGTPDDNDLDGFEIIDLRSCMVDPTGANRQGFMPPGMDLKGKRAMCRPEVFRYRYPNLDISLGHTNQGAVFGCHELEVYPDDRMTCGGGAAAIVFDIKGLFNDNGTPGDFTDDTINGEPLDCRVRPSSSTTFSTTGAQVTDCVNGGPDGKKSLNIPSWLADGAPSATGIKHVGSAFHQGRELSQQDAARPDYGADQDIDFDHELEFTGSGKYLIATDERGGGVLTGSQCSPGTTTPSFANGGLHAYRTDRLQTKTPQAEKATDRANIAFDAYARNAKGDKAIFRTPIETEGPQGSFCTAHVMQQIPGQNRIFMGWYSQGTQVIDFFENADGTFEFKRAGFFIPEATNAWVSAIYKMQENADGSFTYFGATGDGLLEVGRRGIDSYKVTLPAPQKAGSTERPVTVTQPEKPAEQPQQPQQQPQQGQRPQQTPQQPQAQQPTACQSRAGFITASAKGAGRSGGVDLTFRRRVDRPVTVDIFQQSQGRKVTGERRVKRFTNQTDSFTWNGRDSRGRKVPNGVYFARFKVAGANGAVDTVRVTLGKSKGRFGPRRAFYGRDSCGTLGKFKLSRPVFGGTRSSSLGIAYRLNQAARVQVTVTNNRARTIRRYAARDVVAGRTQRLSLSARGLARGDYRVKLSVTRNGQTTTSTLTANRL